ALKAFSAFQTARPDIEARLIIAPRHPDRADEVETEIRAAGHTFQRRTADPSPSLDDKILLADTIGEMGLWLRLANSVYLGGAHTPGVGGHNPIEPLRLKTSVFTGPDAFNFTDLNSELQKTGALQVGDQPDDLAEFWANPPAPDWDAVAWVLARSDAPFEATLDAIENALDKRAPHA
ncbi:MAG: 3-deoxy-D-manno-octulosonic acid transferase, partial [Pseudomonadota bacterium]